MSGHFVYELDERKLRVKVKEFEREQKPESWNSFEAYYAGLTKPKGTNFLPKFNFPFSTSAILPVVFGVLIIIVAVVLFKFVSIKNPEEQINTTEQKVVLPPVEIKKETVDTAKLSLKLIDTIPKIIPSSTLTQQAEVPIITKDSVVKKESKISKNNTRVIPPLKDTFKIIKDTGSISSINISKKDSTKTKRKRNKKPKLESSTTGAEEEIPATNTSTEGDASLKGN